MSDLTDENNCLKAVKAEKRKKCEFCNNCGDNFTKYREFFKNMFSDSDKYIGIAKQIKSGKYVLHIELTEDDYDGDFDINFCPRCGRDLRKVDENE